MNTDRHDLTPLAPGQSAFSFPLRYISLDKYDTDWNSVPHAHGCAELFYIIRGSGQLLHDSGAFPLTTGDLVFVDPLIRHTEAGSGNAPLEYMVLGIENLMLSDLPENRSGIRILSQKDYGEELRSCLYLLRQEYRQRGPGFETACRHLTELLVLRLLRSVLFVRAQTSEEKSTGKECALVRQYIDRHFKEHIDLDLLAGLAHINKYHLSHIFSREYGISPISYLLSLRIRESQRLLRSTDHSLAQIARFTGFSSPSYFSQSFRKAVGMTPAQYRSGSVNAARSTKEEHP